MHVAQGECSAMSDSAARTVKRGRNVHWSQPNGLVDIYVVNGEDGTHARKQ